MNQDDKYYLFLHGETHYGSFKSVEDAEEDMVIAYLQSQGLEPSADVVDYIDTERLIDDLLEDFDIISYDELTDEQKEQI